MRKSLLFSMTLVAVSAFAWSAMAGEVVDGVVTEVAGPIITVNQHGSGEVLYVKTSATVRQEDVGRAVTGACERRGDLCISSELQIGERLQ